MFKQLYAVLSAVVFIFFFSVSHSLAQLSANFSVSTSSGCAPLSSIQFTDLSTGNPTTWLWDFGNGNTSTVQNPVAAYPLPGSYTVTLTVGNGTQTDTETKTNFITVFNIPVCNFTITPPATCVGDTVTLTDNSTLGDAPLVSYTWGFGDGTIQTTTSPSISYAYTLAGVFPVNLIIVDANGCTDDYLIQLPVSQQPVASFTASQVISCTAPFTVNFTNTSTVSGNPAYAWYFGDGGTSSLQNPSHTYNANGSYTVSLVVSQGTACIDSVSYTAFINVGGPAVNIVATDSSVCIYDSTQFSFASTPAATSWQWDFGDDSTSIAANPWHHYNTTGTYTVTLTVLAGGCTSTITQTNFITVHPAPVASFVPQYTNTCLYPYTVQFQNNSTGATSYLWALGGGASSTLQNPSNTYNSTGFYIVSLTAISSVGCINSMQGYVNIADPVASMNIVPGRGCAPLTVNFTSTSSSVDPISLYSWNFGAGQGSSSGAASFTSHTYNTPGTYIVSLAIQTGLGCRDTIIDTVLVGFHTTPNFTISDDTVCYKESIDFTLNTPGANQWYWYFGDGSMDSLDQTPTHVYGNPGTYTVTLVTCNNGCCDTLVVPDMITINPPRAQAYPAPQDCNDHYTVSFINASIGSDSTVWKFGDGTVLSTNASPVSHTYPARGTYTIWIITYNFTSGCVDSIALSYAITEPIANFTASPLSGCYPLQIAFTDTSQDSYTFYWDLGDGTDTLIGSPVYNHIYYSPGYYTVKLVIRDIHNCPDSITKNQYVHVYGPVVNFSPNINAGCRPLPVIFTDNSVSEYPIVQHIWNFYDGTIDTVTTNTISHTYTNTGTFNVMQVAIDSQGCRDTLIQPFLIDVTFPNPALTVDTFACRNELLFFNATTSSVASPYTCVWNFGDGITDSTFSVASTTHAYSSNGIYTISLQMIDRNGCDSTITRTIRIESPNASFTYTDSIRCDNTTVYFNNTSTGTAVTGAYWNFGNGGQSAIINPVYAYTNSGFYNVMLIAINSAGCTDTTILDSLEVVTEPQGSFTFSPDSGCVPLEVTFNITSPDAALYEIDFGDGTALQTTNQSVVHTYYNDVNSTPFVYFINYLLNGDTCNVSSQAGTIYGYTSVGAAILIDGDTAESSVEVALGEQINLSVTSSAAANNPTYNWTPAIGLSCYDCPSPVYIGNGFGSYYTVEVVDAGGCRGIDSILIVAVDCNVAIDVKNVFTPNGDGSNDEFVIRHACVDNFLLMIYNRWGQKIYETNNPAGKWDGRTSDGNYVPAGTYYWIIASGKNQLKGFVELIK